jgi:hypothetical protein
MSIAAANPTFYRSSLPATNTSLNQIQLPKIVHSASRIGDPNFINVTARGVSRASSLGDLIDRMNDENTGRPLPYEFNEDSMNFNMKKKQSKNITNKNSIIKNDYSIPENVKTVYSPDITKPSMPVFGN